MADHKFTLEEILNEYSEDGRRSGIRPLFSHIPLPASSQGHFRASLLAGTVPACGNSLPYQPRNLPRESPLPNTSPDTPESLSPVSYLSIAPPGIASPQ